MFSPAGSVLAYTMNMHNNTGYIEGTVVNCECLKKCILPPNNMITSSQVCLFVSSVAYRYFPSVGPAGAEGSGRSVLGPAECRAACECRGRASCVRPSRGGVVHGGSGLQEGRLLPQQATGFGHGNLCLLILVTPSSTSLLTLRKSLRRVY